MKLHMPLDTRKKLALAALQLQPPAVIVTASLSAQDAAELRRYRLREQRAASAAIACELLATTRGSAHARARELHRSRTAHVRDHTQPAPPQVTLTSAYVHTTLALEAQTAVPIRLPLWQRLWNWLRHELE
jgi:hypothetical protein